MKAESHSSSELLTALLTGGTRKGAVLDSSHLLFGDYVVALTVPRHPRMPNGIACSVHVGPAMRVAAGRGTLTIGHTEIAPGPEWDPLPRAVPSGCLPPGPEPLAGALGPWFTAVGLGYDALLAGYVAGLTLLHGQRKRAEQIAGRAVRDHGPLGATLLRHAARGEVPEVVHELLVGGDSGPLIASGPEGIVWLRGLVSAGLPLEPARPTAAHGVSHAVRGR